MCPWISYSLLASIVCATSLTVSAASSSKGTIINVNRMAKTIQIDQKNYILSDKIRVYSSSKEPLNPIFLRTDQKVEFSTKESDSSTSQEITQIQIVKGIDEAKLPKQ